MSSEQVITAKAALMSALGDNTQKYLDNLKMWFRQKWTKEMFDTESRKLLTLEQMHLHNQFFLAILNKIDTLTSPNSILDQTQSNHSSTKHTSKKRKRSSRLADHATFEGVELYDYLPPEEKVDVSQNANQPSERYVAQELFLPDNGLVMGRLLVGAWEIGLINAEDSAAEMIGIAVQLLLKNILSAILMKKKHYKTTSDGSYFYDIGCPIKNPFSRNTVTRQKIDDNPIEIDREITMNLARKTNEDSLFLSECQELYPTPRRKVTTIDVYKTLLDKNVIPSHSVHSINLERLSNLIG